MLFLLPISAAILGIITFNTGWYFLVFVALAPLFLFFIKENNLWKLIAGAALFRLVFALGSVYFVIDPFLYFFSILIFLGLPLSFYLLRKYASLNLAFWLLPILWTVWDYLEAQYTLLPMTLMMLGNPLAASPFLGLARLGGVLGLTFFAGLVNLLITLLFKGFKTKKERYFIAAAILISLAAGIGVSRYFIRANRLNYLAKKRIFNVELLSASKIKIGFDQLLAGLPVNAKADLLVVPESFYDDNLENSEAMLEFYQKTAKKLGINLNFIGIRKADNKIYKTSFLIGKSGDLLDFYDKNYLTITSEYWPFSDWRPFYFEGFLKKATPEQKQRAVFDRAYSYSAGEARLISGSGFSFASPICLEIHYPGYLKELNDLAPDFIIHNSNNDWIASGLDQYLALSNNLRTIEAVRLKKPLLAAGIKEYAGVFYPDGTSELVYPKNGFSLVNVEVRF